jgi:hypothetical protein
MRLLGCTAVSAAMPADPSAPRPTFPENSQSGAIEILGLHPGSLKNNNPP